VRVFLCDLQGPVVGQVIKPFQDRAYRVVEAADEHLHAPDTILASVCKSDANASCHAHTQQYTCHV